MRSAFELPSFSVATVSPAQVDAQLLVLPFAAGRAEAVLSRLGARTRQDVAWAIERQTARPELGTIHVADVRDEGWQPHRLAVVGAGEAPERSVETVRRIAAAAGLHARQQRLDRVALDLTPLGPATAELVAAAALGFTHANFDHGHLKSREDPFWLTHAVLLGDRADDALRAAAEEGRFVGEAVNTTRLLANEPANRLTPADFAARAATLLAGESLAVRVLDHVELERLRMGLLLGVGRGSDHPPCLVVGEYTPPGGIAVGAPVLGLLGKGITFDTGGISIKPADGMWRMKDDMAGAAAVLSTLRALDRLGAPIKVVGVMPLAENMLSGRATRPGDVLQSASGLTVEVNNTDAEGRLILGDAIWYARQLGATHLVDVATLTGACVVALGHQISGMFARPAAWGEVVAAAARRAGEVVWPMPLHEDYRELLKSEIADMINGPGRAGGAITAALFLEEFARGVPWTHVDIAGTAWTEEAKPWAPKGATGALVRTLIALARAGAAQWPS